MGPSWFRRGDDGTPPLARVLVALPGALLRALVGRMPVPLWRAVIGVCAFVLLLAPLLLWVAWTRSGYLAVLASAGVAMVLAYLLVRHAPEHREL